MMLLPGKYKQSIKIIAVHLFAGAVKKKPPRLKGGL
jgi:hypothetical protein